MRSRRIQKFSGETEEYRERPQPQQVGHWLRSNQEVPECEFKEFELHEAGRYLQFYLLYLAFSLPANTQMTVKIYCLVLFILLSHLYAFPQFGKT
jgi:hypothetical protein